MPSRIVTVTTTATRLLDIHPTRKQYIIQNQGSADIYIDTTKEVATSGTRKGRTLAAGAMESANSIEDFILIKEEQYAIVAAGTADVWVYEA
jgi:hypothetical protein